MRRAPQVRPPSGPFIREKTLEMAMARIVLGIAAALAGALAIGVGVVIPPNEVCAAEQVSFAEDILPIFRGRCFGCHQAGGEGYEKSGLDLTTYAGVMKGTKFGPMVIPKDPDSSNLLRLLE